MSILWNAIWLLCAKEIRLGLQQSEKIGACQVLTGNEAGFILMSK
jgi:hypothetical protein